LADLLRDGFPPQKAANSKQIFHSKVATDTEGHVVGYTISYPKVLVLPIFYYYYYFHSPQNEEVDPNNTG
jgi:hypothetical protein